MKKTTMLLTMLLIAAVTFAKDIKTLVVTTLPEMHCESCETKIKGNLRFEKGIKSVETNIDAQAVTIQYDADKTNEENIIKAFGKFGYQASKKAAEQKAECDKKECAQKKECCKDKKECGDKKECCGKCEGADKKCEKKCEGADKKCEKKCEGAADKKCDKKCEGADKKCEKKCEGAADKKCDKKCE